MANNVHAVLHNILARLPGKPLLRFRCVSKHWNRLISDPYFMKSRSRRMILLPFPPPLVAIDENVPVSMVRIPSPHFEETRVSIVGTLDGIVLLLVHEISWYLCSKLVLYNPLTRAAKVLVRMDHPHGPSYVFGFAYGATTDDLKIVRFEPSPLSMYKMDIFHLKTSSWCTSPLYISRSFEFGGDAGIFLNGVLYWSIYTPDFGIISLNVKDMVLSRLDDVPIHTKEGVFLGSLDGSLCLVNGTFTFDVWLMKEEGVWLKAHSFTFGSEDNVFYPFCILGDGKILIRSRSTQLIVIYDTLKDSYKALDGLAALDKDYSTWVTCDIPGLVTRYKKYPLQFSRSIEYVESLVSPFDFGFI